MSIRGAVLPEPATTVSVEEVELDPPKAGEVLVRVAAAGVCHSDALLADGALGEGRWPMVLGHKGAGVVEAVGDAVTHVAPGDSVGFCIVPSCRECAECRKGGSTSAFRRVRTACGARSWTAPRAYACRTAVVAAARLAGAHPLVAVDRDAAKLEIALERGATHVVEAGSTTTAACVLRLTEGGVEHAFEVVGLPETMRLAWDVLRPRGTAIVVGLAAKGVKVALPAIEFLSDKGIRASYYGNGDPLIDLPQLAELALSGDLDPPASSCTSSRSGASRKHSSVSAPETGCARCLSSTPSWRAAPRADLLDEMRSSLIPPTLTRSPSAALRRAPDRPRAGRPSARARSAPAE